MNKNIICADCKHARKSHGNVMDCKSIGNIQLAALYGKCRRYEPRAKRHTERVNPTDNQPSLFD